ATTSRPRRRRPRPDHPCPPRPGRPCGGRPPPRALRLRGAVRGRRLRRPRPRRRRDPPVGRHGRELAVARGPAGAAGPLRRRVVPGRHGQLSHRGHGRRRALRRARARRRPPPRLARRREPDGPRHAGVRHRRPRRQPPDVLLPGRLL
ncbi:MAG: hypothetical protein AVDCRST_MAG79-1127, partial [uncultured Thermoleophilia bacterium]